MAKNAHRPNCTLSESHIARIAHYFRSLGCKPTFFPCWLENKPSIQFAWDYWSRAKKINIHARSASPTRVIVKPDRPSANFQKVLSTSKNLLHVLLSIANTTCNMARAARQCAAQNMVFPQMEGFIVSSSNNSSNTLARTARQGASFASKAR